MDFSLIDSMTNLIVQGCIGFLILVCGLIVFVALARHLSSNTWWRGWGQPDD